MNSRPLVGETYTDSGGRQLRVTEVNPGDPQGREVVGLLRDDNSPADRYSCTLVIWADIWRDQAPRISFDRQRIG